MKDIKRLLAIKAQLKKRQPKYGRQEVYLKRLEDKWRSPKGLHIKVGERGHPAMLEKGYRTPVAVRGMTKTGLVPVRVAQLEDMRTLDPKKNAIIVARVGGKRRILIIEAAVAKGFALVNANEKVASRLKERFTSRARLRKERSARKAEKTAKLEERAAKAEKEAKVAEKSEEPSDAAQHDHAAHEHHADHDHSEHAEKKAQKKRAKGTQKGEQS
jgi:ribosomal protein L32E